MSRHVCAEGASSAPDCSRACSGVRRGIAWHLARPALDPVALAHGVEPSRRIGSEQAAMALDERNDLVAEVSASNRPLVVRAAAVVVGAVEATPRVGTAEPCEGLLVARVHPQRHLGLAPVATETALADEQPDQEPGRQVIRLEVVGWARSYVGSP